MNHHPQVLSESNRNATEYHTSPPSTWGKTQHNIKLRPRGLGGKRNSGGWCLSLKGFRMWGPRKERGRGVGSGTELGWESSPALPGSTQWRFDAKIVLGGKNDCGCVRSHFGAKCQPATCPCFASVITTDWLNMLSENLIF